MISRLGGDEWAPLPIELRGLKTLAGAACCKLVELPSYKAAPSWGAGDRSGVFIRVYSSSFVSIRGCHSSCQFDTETNPGYYRWALKWAE